MPVLFRGRYVCECVARVFPYVEDDLLARGLIRSSVDLFQGGYNRGGVTASAGTHDLGGCFDVGQFANEHIAVWRRWGVTMQHRTRAQGFDGDHGHGWPRGCPHLSAGARYQAAEWEDRRNGLRGRGRVEGPWPILGFQAAIDRNPTPLVPADVQRIAAATTRLLVDRIPGAVWGADVIPNSFTGHPSNVTVTPRTALARLGTFTRPPAATPEENA